MARRQLHLLTNPPLDHQSEHLEEHNGCCNDSANHAEDLLSLGYLANGCGS